MHKKNQLPTAEAESEVRTVPESSVPDSSVLDILSEAKEILAGRLCLNPTREHLEALSFSAAYWKAKATILEECVYPERQIDADQRGMLLHVPELECDCNYCLNRAEYVRTAPNKHPLCVCKMHAQQMPEWTGSVQ